MQVSIFTDEICREDPARAVELAAAWGVTHVELRSLPGGRFPDVSDAEILAFGELLASAGLQLSGVSPGFCKCAVDDPSVDAAIEESLPRACEWARRLGTDMISGFAFARAEAGPMPERVVERVARMVEVADAHGCRFALENVAGSWGDRGSEAAEIIRRVGSAKLGLCWDPGNSAMAGSADPVAEYARLKHLVTSVHCKNCDGPSGDWALMNAGVVDWPAQLHALAQDGYEGFLVIETHLHIRTGWDYEVRVVNRENWWRVTSVLIDRYCSLNSDTHSQPMVTSQEPTDRTV